MADGGLKIELNEELGERLKAAADAAGRSVDDYATFLLSETLGEGWSEDHARFAEYKRTGEYVDASAAMDTFCKAIAERPARTAPHLAGLLAF